MSSVSLSTQTTGPAYEVAPLPVKVVRSSRRVKSTQAQIKGDHIEVRIPAWLSEEAESEAVSTLVSRLERRRHTEAKPVSLDDRAHRLAQEYDLPMPTSISWSERQKTLWGSCTPSRGTIRISTRLVAAPEWVIDYVVLHELTHLVVPDHSEPFHELMARYDLAERAEGFLLALGSGLACPSFSAN